MLLHKGWKGGDQELIGTAGLITYALRHECKSRWSKVLCEKVLESCEKQTKSILEW